MGGKPNSWNTALLQGPGARGPGSWDWGGLLRSSPDLPPAHLRLWLLNTSQQQPNGWAHWKSVINGLKKYLSFPTYSTLCLIEHWPSSLHQYSQYLYYLLVCNYRTNFLRSNFSQHQHRFSNLLAIAFSLPSLLESPCATYRDLWFNG